MVGVSTGLEMCALKRQAETSFLTQRTATIHARHRLGPWFMGVKAVLGAAALAAFAMAASANAAPVRLAVECGGFPLPFGTTIAAINNHARTVIAVAPVMSASDNRPVAWMVWDERGDGWLGLARFSPRTSKGFGSSQQSPISQARESKCVLPI